MGQNSQMYLWLCAQVLWYCSTAVGTQGGNDPQGHPKGLAVILRKSDGVFTCPIVVHTVKSCGDDFFPQCMLIKMAQSAT